VDAFGDDYGTLLDMSTLEAMVAGAELRLPWENLSCFADGL
jgi:hypothetical protein